MISDTLKILITAGPTREKIDDVRYISNYSSGKMGFALAEIAFTYGFDVTLIAGPVNLVCNEGIHRIDVESADEMYEQSIEHFKNCDIAILSAAVADYAPKFKSVGKLKKDFLGDNPVIELTKTKDILKSLGNLKENNQTLVGFALESENLLQNAIEKLNRKKCDLIVANLANKPNSGFGGDYNTITILDRYNNITEFQPMSKHKCAQSIINSIIEYRNK